VTDEMPPDGLRQAPARRASFLGTLRTVAWSFFGVRKASDHAHDVEGLNPLHLVIAALVAAALFVAGLVALVHWVIASGVAG
jgi:amino acid transporter